MRTSAPAPPSPTMSLRMLWLWGAPARPRKKVGCGNEKRKKSPASDSGVSPLSSHRESGSPASQMLVLLQSCVLGPGLFQDGNVRVGVFPDGEEILIGGARFGLVACHCVGARQAEVSQAVHGRQWRHTRMINDFVKLPNGLRPLACCQMGQTTNVGLGEISPREIIGARTFERRQRANRILPLDRL